MTGNHGERKHSRFSASGAERWFNCPDSVHLEAEAPPEVPGPWAAEGTAAHELAEGFLARTLTKRELAEADPQMVLHVRKFTDWVDEKAMFADEILLETRVHLPFIHEEMFGTGDVTLVEHFGTLEIIDLKYGKSPVDPNQNLQLIFYALGFAHLYDWNFFKARLTIAQPRCGDGEPRSWEVTIKDLKDYWIPLFHKAVARVEAKRGRYFEGKWCHWCKAKNICPLKKDKALNEARELFKI